MKRVLVTLVLAAGIATSAPAVASAAPTALPSHPEPGGCRMYLNDAIWKIPQNWNCKWRSAAWGAYYAVARR